MTTGFRYPAPRRTKLERMIDWWRYTSTINRLNAVLTPLVISVLLLAATIGRAQSIDDFYPDQVYLIAGWDHIVGLDEAQPSPSYEMILEQGADQACGCLRQFAIVVDPVTDETFLVVTPPQVTMRYLQTDPQGDEASLLAQYDQWTLEANHMPTTWLVMARIEVNQVLPTLYHLNGIKDPVGHVVAQRQMGRPLLEFLAHDVFPNFLSAQGITLDTAALVSRKI